MNSGSTVHQGVDPSSALHFRTVQQSQDVAANATTRGGPSHLQREMIERRRSKVTVAESEFDVGVTERLVPELARLPALHELHYGDAVVRELDRGLYLADSGVTAAATDGSVGGRGDGQRMSDAEGMAEAFLTEDQFAAFDAETTAAAFTGTATGEAKNEMPSQVPALAYAADVVKVPLSFGTEQPWFVPASGVVRLEPLDPTDCARLLKFLLQLRQQTEADLAVPLRRALGAAMEPERPALWTEKAAGSSRNSRTTPPSPPLTLADVIRYLDTAPPPVIGLTESLPAPSFSPSARTASPSMDDGTPAFVFHLYLENISSQNAVGHLATLFGLPQRAFQTHSAVSKMSCTTVLCAVEENRLRREHLLILSTLRYPGFVIRVSNIQEVHPARYRSPVEEEWREKLDGADDALSEEERIKAKRAATAAATQSVSQQLFGELARWQPLYETELLLRRVSAAPNAGTEGLSTRQQLEHRLRAVQTLGAICFCANREASLARAATDVLHGFHKSALRNALQRRNAPLPMQRFLRRPNVASATHAHHVSTDATVRHVLKTFAQTNGDWQATVAQTPYVWRRRWINALRGLVWNTMASQRVRRGGREVCLGDVVLKPEYRADVHRRGIITVKAEHVMVVRTAEEAAAACMEDVFLPFLRGRYPEHLFAEDATQHPIMTRTNMLAMLGGMHAQQLLLGMTPELRNLLDVRAESAPILFRRLLVRPLAMEFAVLEDKPPMGALHFDAARLLSNDRWAAAGTRSGRGEEEVAETVKPVSGDVGPSAAPLPGPRHLVKPSEVLERTTLGAKLASGVLAEDFFTVPEAEEYLVLGHAHREVSGGLVPAAPHSDTAEVGDRVYTVYIRAVVNHNLSGLVNLLREYFILSGVETEGESALQHKVHRMRRELDPETPLLTASVYCPTCYNRDHDTQEQCSEYAWKRHRRSARLDRDATVLAVAVAADRVPQICHSTKDTAAAAVKALGIGSEPHHDRRTDASSIRTVRMRWRLHRRNEEQRWGVHLTKRLHLVGLEDVHLVAEGAMWNAGLGAEIGESSSGAEATSLPNSARVEPWPAQWVTSGRNQKAINTMTAVAGCAAQPLLDFMQSVLIGSVDRPAGSESLGDLLMQSPLLMLPPDLHTLQLRHVDSDTATEYRSSKENNMKLFAETVKACNWRLVTVNATDVSTQREVAAALLQHAAHSRDVWLTFDATVDVGPPALEGAAAAAENAVRIRQLPDLAITTTHPAGSIPQSTATLSPGRRHAVEAKMRAAVQKTSPDTQRWLQNLPYRLTIVLVKHQRHVSRHRSWGLQLDGTDMTLVNFAKLMVQYMYATASVEKRASVSHASVASIAPVASFPRNDKAVTQRLFEEVLPDLEPLLNDLYRVVRIQKTPVRTKAEAAQAMAAFQVEMDAKIAGLDQESRNADDDLSSSSPTGMSGGKSRGAGGGVGKDEFYLTLSLERKASGYRLCSAAPAEAEEVVQTGNESIIDLHGKGGRGQPTIKADSTTAATTALTQMGQEVLKGLVTQQCRVQVQTPAQRARSNVTVAINRLVLTKETRQKWGLRLQPDTRRLKSIQQNRFFGFHVFASKQSQGTRIADALRHVPSSRAASQDDSQPQHSSPVSRSGGHVAAHSFFLYFVEQVNQQRVRQHGELRQALSAAAQPLATLNPNSNSIAAGERTVSVSTLPPESVTLGVRQYPLLRLSATVRRGGVGEGSALSPIGLQVDKNMRILSVLPKTPLARALREAAGPLCSINRLVHQRVEEEEKNSASTKADAGSSEDLIALPQLRDAFQKLESAIAGENNITARDAAAATSTEQQRQWAYELDEDEADDGASSSPSPARRTGAKDTKEKSTAAAVAVAAQELASVAADALQELSKLTMVDGLHLLQASLLHEYAIRQLATLPANSGAGVPSRTPEEQAVDLATVKAALADVYAQVKYEVVYAAGGHRALRTPADLAAAFAPGVAEESILIQQFVED